MAHNSINSKNIMPHATRKGHINITNSTVTCQDIAMTAISRHTTETCIPTHYNTHLETWVTSSGSCCLWLLYLSTTPLFEHF